jgi:CheY-like chemotaxis protein
VEDLKEDFKKYTVLIVDDEELLREVIAFEFERKGFTVLSAENGVKAFELIQANPVDLVISDMRMPEGGGQQLLQWVRDYNPILPVVIFITGYCETPEAEWYAKGAFNIITKPFERKVLMDSAMKALAIVDQARLAAD